MIHVYVYSGHFEKDCFLRDYLYDYACFKTIHQVKFFIQEFDMDNYDCLIELPNGEYINAFRFRNLR